MEIDSKKNVKDGALRPRYPVFWITIILFGLVAAATWEPFLIFFIVFLVLPVVLFLQFCLRLILKLFKSPVWLCRSILLLPALWISIYLFQVTNSFGGAQRESLRVALSTKVPSGFRDIRVREDAWTDYTVWAYFRLDPVDFNKVLSGREYQKMEVPFELDMTAAQMYPCHVEKIFPDVTPFEVAEVYEYEKSDTQTYCKIWTDASHSQVFLIYGTD